MPDKAIYNYKDKRDAINVLYGTINQKVVQADITSVMKQVQDVVNKSIETLNVELEKLEGYGQKIDISSLDFQKIEEEFLKVKDSGNENIAVQSLKDKIERKINKMVSQNPIRKDFYEKYQQIIEQYNNGKDRKSVV